MAVKMNPVTVSPSSAVVGMNKMVINHLEKLFVTNDAATVIKELEVEHPAARMIVMATQMMQQEVWNQCCVCVCVCVCVYVCACELCSS